MPASIAVEVIASPPLEADVVRRLITSCAEASGPGGCILETSLARYPEARAHVVVEFGAGFAWVRVRIRGASAMGHGGARGIRFSSDDPLPDRLRATGLVVAGLMSDAPVPPPAAPTPPLPVEEVLPLVPPAHVVPPAQEPDHPPSAPVTTGVPLRASVSAGALLGLGPLEPRFGVAAGGDLSAGTSPWFGAVVVGFDETLAATGEGLSELRGWAGVGGGLRVALARDLWELQVPFLVEVEGLRVSVVQPSTGKRDSGSRLLGGASTGADIFFWADAMWGVGTGFRISRFQTDTTVRVAGATAAVIPAWSYESTIGLRVQWR